MIVKWSYFAEDQQADILRYLTVKMSVEDAIRWAHRFHDDVERLIDQPSLGHPVSTVIFDVQPLLIERLREIFSGSYRIIYEPVDDVIRILSITHTSKLVERDHLVWDR